jgi:hypothetical protein
LSALKLFDVTIRKKCVIKLFIVTFDAAYNTSSLLPGR